MTPKERYQARRAAKKAGFIVRERGQRDDPIHDPEELLFDIANSLNSIALSLEAIATARPLTSNISIQETT